MRGNLFVISIFLFSSLFGQFRNHPKVTGNFTDVTVEVILDSLSAQTDYFFSYNSQILPKGSLYTIGASEEPIDQFLSRLFVGTGLKYSFFKDQVILNYVEPEKQRANL